MTDPTDDARPTDVDPAADEPFGESSPDLFSSLIGEAAGDWHPEERAALNTELHGRIGEGDVKVWFDPSHAARIRRRERFAEWLTERADHLAEQERRHRDAAARIKTKTAAMTRPESAHPPATPDTPPRVQSFTRFDSDDAAWVWAVYVGDELHGHGMTPTRSRCNEEHAACLGKAVAGETKPVHTSGEYVPAAPPPNATPPE